MKKIGYLLFLTASILTAISTIHDKETINWPYYVLFIAVGLVGVIFIKIANRKEATHEGKLESDIKDIERTLENLCKDTQGINNEKKNLDVFDLHKKIDEKLVCELEGFANARESIKHMYGLKNYSDLMSHFASGERYINRVWSASVDGYIDEAHDYLEKASEQFRLTKELLYTFHNK